MNIQGLKAGTVLTNSQIVSTFKCGNMGGMRRSKKTNTLVLISDSSKGFYRDEWEGGILLYTGMGKTGNQVLKGNQNKTLAESGSNSIGVHLFEVFTKKSTHTKAKRSFASLPIKASSQTRTKLFVRYGYSQ